MGNETVTVADSGTMKITSDKRYMVLNLFSGETHAEIQTSEREKSGYPTRTDKFKSQTIFSNTSGDGTGKKRRKYIPESIQSP